MKLFKSLLVAPAALGLLAPLAATASEVNLNDISNYSDEEIEINSNSFDNSSKVNSTLLAGGEGLISDDEDGGFGGSFSDTTVLDQTVVFSIGGAEHTTSTSHPAAADHRNEGVAAQYSYTMNLNSSFTGDDNLYIRIKTGNGAGWMSEKDEGGYLSATNTNGDALKVDKLWYTFPIGDRQTVWIGPKIENYYMHATTPSLYSPTLKQFTLGGNGAAYGASTNSGFGWAYKADNGIAVSSNVVSQQNFSSTNTGENGFATAESKTSWATQVGYTQPQYSVSAIVNYKSHGWTDEYFSTASGLSRASVNGSPASDSTNIGLRAWLRPEESGSAFPSVSVGYDFSDIQYGADNQDSTDMWFAGFGWNDMFRADDKIGVAIGQPQQREDETTDPFGWEAYYAFKANDATEYRATVFGGQDRNGTAGDDIQGAVFQTTFKF